MHCGVAARLLLDSADRLRISKLMSGLLRHFPQAAGLNLDREGYARIAELLKALREWRGGCLGWITQEHILAIASLDPKGRFEVAGDRIRASYGHSCRVEPCYPVVAKPGTLFHGTQAEKLSSIMRHGLKPIKRLYVHLTKTVDNAWETACRRSGTPIVLVVDGDGLVEAGFEVYKASEIIYLTRHVPPSFIKEIIWEW